MQAVIFPRRSTRGVLLGLSLSQVAVLGGAGTITLLFLISVGMGAALWCAVLVGVPACAMAFVRIGTRNVVEWVIPVVEFWWKKTVKQDKFHRRLLAPRDAGALHLPGEAASLRLVEDATDSAALVWDKNAKCLTAIASLDHGQFLSLNDSERDAESFSWASVMSQIAAIEGVTRFQILCRSLPEHGDDLEKAYEEEKDSARANSLGDRLYRELLASAGASMRRHETFLAVQISHKKAKDLVKDSGGGLSGLTAVMSDVRHQVEAALRECHVSVDSWLVSAELARLIRGAFDPNSWDELNAGLGSDISFAAPITSAESWTHLQADSGFFQTWRVNAWPRIATTAGFLRPLLMEPRLGMVSFSMIFEPVPAELALAKANRAVTAEETARDERRKSGRIDTIVHERERAQAMRHLDDIAAGHADMMFTGLITVGGTSREQMRKAGAKVRAAAIKKNVDIKISYGQQQVEFLSSALPLARKAW